MATPRIKTLIGEVDGVEVDRQEFDLTSDTLFFDNTGSNHSDDNAGAAIRKSVHPYDVPSSLPSEDGYLLRWNHNLLRWFGSNHLVHKTYSPKIKIITASNSTIYLSSTDEYVYVIIGTTLGQIIRLPNATTLLPGHQFWIINEASVPITLQDFNGGVPLNIVAQSNVHRVLLENTTSSGVWNVSLGASWLTGKLRDPRPFSMNGTVGNGNWISISELIPSYKYVFTEPVKLIGMEWSNGGGSDRSFDLVFYKNGILAANIVRTYQVRNSTNDYGSAILWDNLFAAGDYMRVMYVDQGNNVSDFAGRFNFEVTV